MPVTIWQRCSAGRGLTRIAAAIAPAMALLALAGCGSGSSTTSSSTATTSSGAAVTVDQAARSLLPSSVRSSGVLTDAVDSPEPPLQFPKPGTKVLQGFDIDLANALAAKLGLKVSFEEVPFVQLLPSLQTGRVDISASGETDLPTRRAVASWIDYFKEGTRMFIAKTDASKYPTLASLCGQTISAPKGSSYETEIPELSADLCKGKSAMKVLPIGESLAEAELAVQTGRAAGGTYPPFEVTFLAKPYMSIGENFAPQLDGIAVKAGNTEMLGAVKAALTDLIDDGTYAAIAKKWGQTGNEVTTVTVNAGNAAKVVVG
ncbi:MAG: transporter substrate-binding domain-containing protein [Solirubrobacteraceae bacterium]